MILIIKPWSREMLMASCPPTLWYRGHGQKKKTFHVLFTKNLLDLHLWFRDERETYYQSQTLEPCLHLPPVSFAPLPFSFQAWLDTSIHECSLLFLPSQLLFSSHTCQH